MSLTLLASQSVKSCGDAQLKALFRYDVRFRDQRRFRFEEMMEGDFGFTLRMATREEPLEGVPLPARKFVVQRYWAHNNGDPYGAGLARILYPLVKFKRQSPRVSVTLF